MPENRNQLTVYFDPPFWVGVYERIDDGQLSVSKIVFGSEPKDYEVYDHLQKNWQRLVFSPPVVNPEDVIRPQNPKRLQRAIKETLKRQGISTKSQQALQLQREARKTQRQERSREEKEAEKTRRFTQRQEKRKEKRRGH